MLNAMTCILINSNAFNLFIQIQIILCLTDGTIQKLKQQYNQSGGPALEVTLAEVQEDLRIHPPQMINFDEAELANGIANGHIEQGPASGKADSKQQSRKCDMFSFLLGKLFLLSLSLVKKVRIKGLNQ